MSTVNFLQRGSSWQPGRSTLGAAEYDPGTLNLTGPPGSNRVKNVTNQTGEAHYVCRHYQTDKHDMYKHQFQQFCFRFIHPKQNNTAKFLQWQQNLLGQIPYQTGSTESNKRKKRFKFVGPVPYCDIYTVPQLNYIFAREQLEKNSEFTAAEIFSMVRPIGVNITEESTAELYDSKLGDLRVHRIAGPTHITNCFAEEIHEDDIISLLIYPVIVQPNSVFKYAVENDQKGLEIVKADKFTGEFIWQFKYHVSESEPELEDYTEYTNDGLVVGTYYKLARIQHVYVEHSFTVKDEMFKSHVVRENSQIENRQDLACRGSTLKIFVLPPGNFPT